MDILFSKNLLELRKGAGLKQKELAIALHTTQRTISYWETGKIQPDLEDLCMIANYFNISIDELIGRKR